MVFLKKSLRYCHLNLFASDRLRLVVVILSALLALSLALNVYLYGVMTLDEFGIKQQEVSKRRTDLQQQPQIIQSVNAPSPIEIAFNEFDFSTVLVLFEQQQLEDPEGASEVKLQWFELVLSAIRSAKDNQEAHPYSEFIRDFLKLYPYDHEFLYLEVLDQEEQDNPTDLLVTLYGLLQVEISDDLRGLIGGKIREEFDRMVKQLSDLGAWDILATSLETIHSYSPNDRRILVNLAHAYAQSEQFGLMENILSYLPPSDDEAIRLRQYRDSLLAREEVEKTDDSGIALERVGDQFLVSASIENEYRTLLLIDTGASTTVISELVFRRLQRRVSTEFLGRYGINTANGQIRAPVYRFASLSIGEFSVPDIAIVVLPLEELEADGLLGMNFLRAFRFVIDQDDSTLHLFRRE